MPICGNCHQHHDTVADVRLCYGNLIFTEAVANAGVPDHLRANNKAREDGPTDAQWEFFKSLAKQLKRPVHDKDRALYTIKSIKPLIQKMKDERDALPRSEQPAGQQDVPDVPAGRYGIPSLTGNNDYDFFKVDKPTEGRWKGYTFVNRVIGGKPDVGIRSAPQRRAILEAIISYGIDESHTLFGTQLGYCWACGRHLTDETSRSLGIGPDCRSN
jgi:hypothetical protein